MRIKIINFRVQETFVMKEDLNFFQRLIRCLFGPPLEIDYHFDLIIKVNEDYIDQARKLEKNDRVDLPNKVRLKVWSVDRGGIIRAKTMKMIKEDLRNYHPIEMFLVYDVVQGQVKR